MSEGLLEPFITKVGVKQGCVFSPLLFNLYINKIDNIFDKTCHPVQINKTDLNCLLWADDLVLVSETKEGLQNSLNKIEDFYNSLGLKINTKKTKVMIFNKKGVKLDKIGKFFINGRDIETVNEYPYLGIILKSSGSMDTAVNALSTKASRAWFSLSNVIYTHKRMEITKACNIFDSFVTPVALYL